ncbi:MAG: hypothetical protein HYZ26_08195 [Chloroflexi bacterium]|nr:hypothetical protein [Chloroflexota bacterium]
MSEPITRPQLEKRRPRRQLGLYLTLAGFAIFIIGAEPALFGLDRSEVIGFVQITVFIFGLGVMCLGGSVALDALWPRSVKSIIAELGVRVAWTGYVIALASAMADVFGLGTRPLPATPFFGYWQERGVLVGEVVIILGFLMMIPLNPPEPPESEPDDPVIETAAD